MVWDLIKEIVSLVKYHLIKSLPDPKYLDAQLTVPAKLKAAELCQLSIATIESLVLTPEEQASALSNYERHGPNESLATLGTPFSENFIEFEQLLELVQPVVPVGLSLKASAHLIDDLINIHRVYAPEFHKRYLSLIKYKQEPPVVMMANIIGES